MVLEIGFEWLWNFIPLRKLRLKGRGLLRPARSFVDYIMHEIWLQRMSKCLEVVNKIQHAFIVCEKISMVMEECDFT